MLQEVFTRERDTHVAFARLLVNAVLSLGRVLVPETVKGRLATVEKNEAEMARLIGVFEAEVHQDIYRHDVIAAINERLNKRTRDTNFAATYDEVMQSKVSAFGED